MNRNKRIILLSERGWRGIREFSSFLADRGVHVFVLIKGRPSKEVRCIIKPYSGIHNIFIPRKIYSIWIFIYLFFNLIFYKVYLFSSRKNKRGLVNFLKMKPLFIYEKSNGYCIQDNKEKEIKPETVLEKIYL